ncbi:MAG: hypothetical protein UT63_C0040G0007 [Candidatus Gottesmanbacteria bacterium GW2011_GWC2_39_8]|uniref:Uncharacterized protein n=1 Tax=Candidatus Gottesmanbacteria bacterium GW2011_GWC2_39_8 TaxID=1618450 RepID=A0A0G0PWJ8_9BACT|nr:MAG: hypothetical protein UT63_C0040G0007 [Candidatus Gottesmanbacteria bacterium GW2011_GWC2_39_8]
MVRLLQWIVSGKKEIRKLAELNIKSMGRGGFLPVGRMEVGCHWKL